MRKKIISILLCIAMIVTLTPCTKYSDVYGYDNLMGSTSVLYIDKTNSGNDSKTANYSYVVTAADAYNGYKRRSEENRFNGIRFR